MGAEGRTAQLQRPRSECWTSPIRCAWLSAADGHRFRERGFGVRIELRLFSLPVSSRTTRLIHGWTWRVTECAVASSKARTASM